LCLYENTALAQTVTATVNIGAQTPGPIAVNSATNKIYVATIAPAGIGSAATVVVIDGATNGTSTVGLSESVQDIAVNSATNEIYAVGCGDLVCDGYVAVIDGATNSVNWASAGWRPSAVAVNSATNKIYVKNYDSVTVVDGATNSTGTISVGAGYWASSWDSHRPLAVNQATNKIYVANWSDNSVTVIDGASNNTITINDVPSPSSLAVNPVTDKIYVTGSGGSLAVIDGDTNNVTRISGAYSDAVAVNPVTNQVYVPNQGAAQVAAIDGLTNSISIVNVGSGVSAIAVNPATNKIYVANAGSNTITAIDGVTNDTGTIDVGLGPNAIAINLINNIVYVVNICGNDPTCSSGGTVSVIDGTPSLDELAAMQAEKLTGGQYGEGGKGFDYSLAFKDTHGNRYPPSDGNSCEVSSAPLPCWITPADINDPSRGYWYWDSNPGYAGVLAPDYGVDCSGLVTWSYNTAAGATTQAPGTGNLPILWAQVGVGVGRFNITSISRLVGTVEVTTGKIPNGFRQGRTVQISGVADKSFDSPKGGAFTIASVISPTQFTYAQSGNDSSSSAGVAASENIDGQCTDAQSIFLTNDLGDTSNPGSYAAPSDLRAGDLLCFRYHTNGDPNGDAGGHVAMYVGSGTTADYDGRPADTIEDYERSSSCPIRCNGVQGWHVNSGSGYLARVLEDSAGTQNCALPSVEQNSCFDFLGYRRPKAAQTAILLQVHSPVSLSVTDPGGFTIDANAWVVTPHEAYRAAGSLSYNDYSPTGDDMVFSPVLESGPYIVRVIPKPGATPDETYSLTATVGSNTTTLAEDVPISQIPPAGYGLQSNGTTVAPFTPIPSVSFGGSVQQPLTNDGNGHFLATVTITNQGNVTIDSAQIGTATLGTASLASTPASITNLAPSASTTVTLSFPITSALATATSAPLKISGTYSAGTLSGNWSLTFRSVTLAH